MDRASGGTPDPGGWSSDERRLAEARVSAVAAGLGEAERAALALRLVERVVAESGSLAAVEALLGVLSDEAVRRLDRSRPGRRGGPT